MMPQLFDMDMMVRHDQRSVVLKMEPSASFSQVISSLYDCAIVPDLWPRVLPMLANYMKSRTAAVSSRSRVADKPHFLVEFGIDEAVHALYVSKYRAINPR